MRKILVQFAVLVLAFAPGRIRAGGDEVVVIYNTRVPESRAVAEHYALARHVPKKQIYGFPLTTGEVISRDEFRDSLQLPLARRLESDGLWRFGYVTNAPAGGRRAMVEHRVVASKIRYALLCFGVPLKIAPDPALQQMIQDNPHPELQRDEAAVDSELTWLPLIDMDVRLPGPLSNWVYGATNAAALNPTNGILLVTRLDGPSAEIAEGLVDKAMQAERDGLWGRAYFDTRGLSKTDTNYFLGDAWILDSAEICRELGYETVVDKNPGTFPADFPMSQIAIYAGWYTANADGPFALSTVEFMPGAFAYHLHSFSAATLRTTTQNWCGPLLAKGATCTMGCVNEPYLAGTPNVAAFLGRLASGFTFGEAAWAAQPFLSWQTTVIGDPLYRPFGKSPVELHAELERAHDPLIEWSYLRIVNAGLLHGVPVAKLEAFLENLPATTNSAVLTEKLADLYETLGKPASAIDAWQRALGLNPSPEQRIRIRLMLGEKLQEQGRDADAIENYRMLLKESPEYPGWNSVSEKMSLLEQKLAGEKPPAKP